MIAVFETLPSPEKRQPYAIIASLFLEAGLLFALLYRPPMFVQPSSLAWGKHGTSEVLVYTALQSQVQSPAKKTLLRIKKKRQQKVEVTKAEVPPQPAPKAGTPYGSLYQGPGSGRDARPALPLIFPDPSVYSWQLGGLQGDVIVEVTIDEHGNVTDTRVLQSLKNDIDEKVVATVKNWRFRPAVVDGVATSSRQDVHFHFPS